MKERSTPERYLCCGAGMLRDCSGLPIPQVSRLIGKYDSRVSYRKDGVQVACGHGILPGRLINRSRKYD